MSLQLWIPSSAKRRVWRCESCGREYPLGPENLRRRRAHAIRCAEVNEEVLMGEFHDEAIAGSVFTNRDDAEELAEVRQKALREGVRGKGLNP